MRVYLPVAVLTLSLAACSQPDVPAETEAQAAPEAETSAGTVERLDPALDALIGPDAVVEKIADGFQFIEGPVWMPEDGGYLLFSDIPANAVLRWSEADGVSTFLDPVLAADADTGASGGSNGLNRDLEGRLILCEHGNRRVARMESDGTRTTLADRYDGRRLNSPNDIVFLASGSAYFTDPPYGLAGQDESENKEVDQNGVYRLDPDGTVTLVAAGQTRPNGIGISPNESTLYVANSDADRVWWSYPVNEDGSLGEGGIFFDASGSEDQGVPDGLAVDALGNVWATGPGGVWVLSPEGVHLGTVKPAENPANAGFGEDGKTLFMTARTGLYRIRTEVSGLGM